MPAKRVLYVNHVAAVSGAEQSLLALLSHLDPDLVSPVLACPEGELAERARQLGIECRQLNLTNFKRASGPLQKSGYAVAWVAGTNSLRRIVRLVAPNAIHANSAKAQIYAGSVARKAGIPCVWYARDLRPLPFPARGLCRKAQRVIAVSEAVADCLAGSGLSRPKVTRIYNGVDADAWRARVTGADVRAQLGFGPDDRIILMAAQFVPWKRHEDAIRALPRILERQPHTRLVLAGTDRFGDHPDLRQQLETAAVDSGVSDAVVFAGQRDDVPDLMSAADLVVIPSDAEPFGRVAIEAMSLGKPVVGTRAGGLPEVVRDGETGLLVVPRYPESLAEACLRILEHPSLALTLGQAGRQRVDEHFRIRDIARQTQALYETLLRKPVTWTRA